VQAGGDGFVFIYLILLKKQKMAQKSVDEGKRRDGAENRFPGRCRRCLMAILTGFGPGKGGNRGTG
jgi:hypothetical protein